MRWLLLCVMVAACAHSQPDTRTGSADEALASSRPAGTTDDDCPETHSATKDFVNNGDTLDTAPAPIVAAEGAVAVTSDALDSDKRARAKKCHADAAHDRQAEQIQQQRAAAVSTDAAGLTQKAITAARAGDCATVKSLEGSVDDDDPAYHDAHFVTDPDIQKCLAKR